MKNAENVRSFTCYAKEIAFSVPSFTIKCVVNLRLFMWSCIWLDLRRKEIKISRSFSCASFKHINLESVLPHGVSQQKNPKSTFVSRKHSGL